MASVVRKRKSQFWYACFSLPDGRRRQLSTRTKDKKTAQKIAWAAEEASRKKATSEQARKIIAGVVEEIHGELVSNESCAEYFERWKARRSRELARATVDRIGDVFKSLGEFLGSGWGRPLSDLTPGLVAGWRDGLAVRYAPVTVNVYLKIVKQALRDAWSDGILSESPAVKIKMLKIPKGGSGKKVFTTAQYVALVAVARGEWLGMIHAGAFTGQRLSDIVSMKLADIEDCWWRFKSRKTGAMMAIPLASAFLDWLRVQIGGRKFASAYVFPDAHRIFESSNGKVGTLSNQFYRIMVDAGLAEARDNNASLGVGRAGKRAASGLSFHSFRHTCTTWLKAQGEPESVAMAFVGHESKAVNRSYTHLPEASLLAAMKKMEAFAA